MIQKTPHREGMPICTVWSCNLPAPDLTQRAVRLILGVAQQEKKNRKFYPQLLLPLVTGRNEPFIGYYKCSYLVNLAKDEPLSYYNLA